MQEEIARRIREQMSDAQVDVVIEGNRALIDVISSHFEGMSRVKKQQAVYAFVEDFIADGSLHAVTIRANTPES